MVSVACRWETAAAAEAGTRFAAVDAETLSLIGFAGDETQAELRSNLFIFFPSPPHSLVNQMFIPTKRLKIPPLIYLFRANRHIADMRVALPPRPAFSLASQQECRGRWINNGPPSSRHTNGIPVAGVSWPEVWECLFNIRGVGEAHLGTNGSPLSLLLLAASGVNTEAESWRSRCSSSSGSWVGSHQHLKKHICMNIMSLTCSRRKQNNWLPTLA